jgi:hypothetical protein
MAVTTDAATAASSVIPMVGRWDFRMAEPSAIPTAGRWDCQRAESKD